MFSIYNCLKSKTTYYHSIRKTKKKKKNYQIPQKCKGTRCQEEQPALNPRAHTVHRENLSLYTALSPPCVV